MTQEEKNLLIKDLSARLPYEINIRCKETPADENCKEEIYSEQRLFGINFLNIETEYTDSRIIISVDEDGDTACYNIEDVKPYLRPMSSMTEIERRCQNSLLNTPNLLEQNYLRIDWLNKHHFDYRSLIEKGLALKASEDMYNINH